MSAVARMSDEEAHAKFVEIRWAHTEGKPYCPECGCAKVYVEMQRVPLSVLTARTIFQDRKRAIRDYLLAAIFVNGVKGHSALQLSRILLAHKLCEGMASEVHSPDQPELSRTVEIAARISAARSSRRTAKPTVPIAAKPRNRPASARS